MLFEGVPKTPESFDNKTVLQNIENVVSDIKERIENSGQEISKELVKFYEDVESIADSVLRSSSVIDR